MKSIFWFFVFSQIASTPALASFLEVNDAGLIEIYNRDKSEERESRLIATVMCEDDNLKNAIASSIEMAIENPNWKVEIISTTVVANTVGYQLIVVDPRRPVNLVKIEIPLSAGCIISALFNPTK